MQIFHRFKKMIAKVFQNKSVPIQTLKVTMLGPIGVGKTSLLAAIYDQFDRIIGQTNLQLTPDSSSATILARRLQDLKSLVGNSIRTGGGIQGTSNPRSYFFDLGKTGVSASVRLHFQDYPGSYIDSEATSEQIKTVEGFIRESAAVLIAIDTPVLMESEGKWHERLNKPEVVRNLFKEAYRDLDSPRLVIFAPIKCEKYLQNERDASELLRRLTENYGKLLDFFSADALISNVAVVVTPVQTVGSVVFSRIEVKDGEPYFYFRKLDPDEPYQPRDSEQPLRYLLRFLLGLHIKKRRIPIIESILNFFGRDAVLKEAIREFANGCKTTGGFSVLQGVNLLKINGD